MVLFMKCGLSRCFGKYSAGKYNVGKEQRKSLLGRETHKASTRSVKGSYQGKRVIEGKVPRQPIEMDPTDIGNRPKAFSTTDLYYRPRLVNEGSRSHSSSPSGSPTLPNRDGPDGHVPYQKLHERKPRAMSQPIADYFSKQRHAHGKGKSIEQMLKEPRTAYDEVPGYPQKKIRLKVIKIESSV